MNQIIDGLSMVGDHFMLVVAACCICVFMMGIVHVMFAQNDERKRTKQLTSVENIVLQELEQQKSIVCLWIRLKDVMPFYTIGDINGLLGVTLEQVQADLVNLMKPLKNAKDGDSFWNAYRIWDGEAVLELDLQLNDFRWIHLSVERTSSKEYDIFYIYETTEIHRKLEIYSEKMGQMEEESKSKTKFLSRMSHEIRTPMNGIIGMLTLAEGKLEKHHPAMQYLEKADELSDHLLNLINDILDMSRIEAGKVELEKAVFNLKEFGNRLYDMFAKNLQERGIHYIVTFEGLTEENVIGDELRLNQIIINFLSNAMKFTKEGEIFVTFRQMMLQEHVMDLMIRVHDTGIGMEPEFIHRIFRPFEQEEADTVRLYGGSGLGMAITDQLVQLMGGEIVVESELGKGSDFTVFLHLPVAETAKTSVEENKISEGWKEATEEDAFRGRRILLAEDNEVNAMISVEILEEMGAKVDIAENGQVAINRFAEKPVGYYDFILMDIQMPVMDGRTAARKIRRLQRPDAKKVLIFALSADAFVEDERLSIESGMNGHYVKPVDFILLWENISIFLKKKE